jgi:hypothetical protein
MAKQKQFKYGIEITKPWSTEMYAHNEKVLEQVKNLLFQRIIEVLEWATINNVLDLEWRTEKQPEHEKLQRGITSYGFGQGFNYAQVIEKMINEVNQLHNWRANEIANDLKLNLEQEFIGFNN